MTDIKDFVKNHDLLKEDYRHNTGFAKFDHIDLVKRIDELNRTCVLALVGPYGSGKSTALNRTKKDLKDTKWLQFDAWRYPERKALWDGLIIEVAKQLGDLKKVQRAVDGNVAAIGKWGGITTSIFATATEIMPKGALEWVGDKFHSLPNLGSKETKEIKDAGPVADKLVKNLFGKSAAKRAYEFEKILTDLLLSVKEPRIVIVVEDVDRSGSDGLHFLETLSFYLKNNERLAEEQKKVIAIAPVSEESYVNNDETYLKCVDYIEFFRPRQANLDDFIEEVFNGLDMHPYRQVDVGEMPLSLIADQTKYFLEGLFNTFPTEMSMRKLKMIIREASSAYRIMQLDGHKPDWLIVLCVQSTKHFRDHYTQPNKSPTYYDLFVKDKKLLASRSNAFFANTISAITDGRKQDKDLPQSVIIGNPNISAKGHDFIIDDSLISESRPVPRRVDRGRFEFYIPGYYFRY